MRCSASQSTHAAVQLRSAQLRVAVLGSRHRALLGVLEQLPGRGAQVREAGAEALVVAEHVRAQHVEEVGAQVERGCRRAGLHELGAERATGLERALEAVHDVRLGLDQRQPRRRRDAGAAQRRAPAAAVPRAHRLQRDRAVGQLARHRPRMVEAAAQREDAAQRQRSARRLDRRGPRQGRRDAQRARRVGTGGQRDQAGRQGRGGAAARAAGRTVQRPRVADLVGGAAGRALVRVQVADEHRAGSGEPRPDVAVGIGLQRNGAAGGGQRLAGDRVEVLEPDRDAAQRVGGLGGAKPRVGALGSSAGVLLVHAHERVYGIRAPVEAGRAVGGDPGQVGVEQLGRRELTLAEQPRRLGDAQPRRVGHGAVAASASRSAKTRLPSSGSK